jgi:hypothetical protein
MTQSPAKPRKKTVKTAATNDFPLTLRKGKNGLEEVVAGKLHIGWINTGGEFAPGYGGMYDFSPMLQDFTLIPGTVPHITFLQLPPMPISNEGCELKFKARAVDGRIEITASGSDAGKYFQGSSLTVVDADPARTGQLRITQTFELTVTKDIDARLLQAGKLLNPPSCVYLTEVDGMGPCMLLEIVDPWFDSQRGPSTEMSKNWKYRTPYAGLDAFTKSWKRRYDVLAFDAIGGGVQTMPLSLEKLCLMKGRYSRPMKNGGVAGQFTSDKGNPAIRVESNEVMTVSLCQWIYDTHLVAAIPLDTPRELWGQSHRIGHNTALPGPVAASRSPILRAGRKVTLKTEMVCYSVAESKKFIADAKPIEIDLSDRGRLEQCPASAGVKNEFDVAATDRPDCVAWKPSSWATWDRETGHKNPGSLRITNDGFVLDGAWVANGGRSRFCEPLTPGIKYRYSAWIKTWGVGGEGAFLELYAQQYINLGNPGERQGERFHFRTPAVKGNTHWAYVEAVVGPFPEDCTNIDWVARLKSGGTAWFDEIALEPME